MNHFLSLSVGILDDQDLVETLQQSKGMAKEIYERIAQSEEAEKRLSLARKRFLPVSTVLGFCLAKHCYCDKCQRNIILNMIW